MALPRTAEAAAPRRLNRQARRDQLVAAALPLVARHGPLELSLDAVAARAAVTRNLLYHYFPDGRVDLLTAVIREAERQLLGDLDEIASDRPFDRETALTRLLDHALAPTHAWRVHRLARGVGLPAVTELLEHSTRVLAVALAGVPPAPGEPRGLAEAARHGFVAFAESALDIARTSDLPRAEIRRLLDHVLGAALSAR